MISTGDIYGDILTLLILLIVGLWIYAKIRKQTITETAKQFMSIFEKKEE